MHAVSLSRSRVQEKGNAVFSNFAIMGVQRDLCLVLLVVDPKCLYTFTQMVHIHITASLLEMMLTYTLTILTYTLTKPLGSKIYHVLRCSSCVGWGAHYIKNLIYYMFQVILVYLRFKKDQNKGHIKHLLSKTCDEQFPNFLLQN